MNLLNVIAALLGLNLMVLTFLLTSMVSCARALAERMDDDDDDGQDSDVELLDPLDSGAPCRGLDCPTGRRSGALLALLLCSPAAATASIEDCIDATCRVKVGNGTGTGCAFAIVGDQVHILTNYHVAEGSKRVSVEFWKRGHKSRQILGASHWYAFVQSGHRDINIVAVPIAAFGRHVPRLMPLAPRGTRVAPGQPIVSCGCEHGAWPSAWKGHVEDLSEAAFRFSPMAIPGRSGSAVFDEPGEQIVGLIAWHDGKYGIAMTLEELYRAFDRQPHRTEFAGEYSEHQVSEQLVDVVGASTNRRPVPRLCVHGVPLTTQCPNCPGGSDFNFGWGFGHRRPPQQQPYGGGQQPYQGGGGNGEVYPTLPAAPPATDPLLGANCPWATKAELAALEAKLTKLLDGVTGAQSNTTDRVQTIEDDLASAVTDAAANAAAIAKLKDATGKHGSVLVDIQAKIQAALDGVSGLADGHASLKNGLGTLKSDVEGALANVPDQAKAAAAQTAGGLLAGKLAEIGPIAGGLTLGPAALLGGLPAAGLALGALLLRKRAGSGGPAPGPFLPSPS